MKNNTLNSRLIHVYNFRMPGGTLDFELLPLDKCLGNGMVVLDANVLLLPLATGALTLSAIERVFRKLIDEDRLFIPTHALREYLANRSTKIKELIDQLVKKKEKGYASSSSPLLQKASVFGELTAAEDSLKAESAKVAVVLTKAINEIKGWETNDPVSAMYRSLSLSSRLLSDPVDFDNENDLREFLQENDDRVNNRVPPGFKDSGKGENDIGDFLIWKSVLQLGKTHPNANLTFVSGEMKTDWLYRSAGQTLHVREELIEEYRRISGGGSFHLIDLATLLEKFKESEQVVEEVRSSEKMAAISKSHDQRPMAKDWNAFAAMSMDLVEAWLKTETNLSDVTESIYPFTHLQGVSSDSTHLIYVRPLRHVEHVLRRVLELKPKILKDLELASMSFPLAKFRGGLIFVCESSENAKKVADILVELKDDKFTIVAGSIENEGFTAIY